MRVLTVSKADGSSVDFRDAEDFKVTDGGALLIVLTDTDSLHVCYVGYAAGQWIDFTSAWVDE